jgi:hypothetical protein
MVTKTKVQHMQDKNILDILGTPLWSITMPIPPSTNSLFMPVATKGRSRMVITKEYREWRKSLDLIEWKDAPIFTHKVFIVVEVRPGPTLSDKADADNFAEVNRGRERRRAPVSSRDNTHSYRDTFAATNRERDFHKNDT